ncbi:MAG TPA: hypothetical protein VII92_10825 [Anaerolineae bacterium]
MPAPVELRPSTPIVMPGIFIETGTRAAMPARSGAGYALLIVGIVAVAIIFTFVMINNAVTA